MSEKKTYPFCLIDGTVLTNGVRVDVAGIELGQFERNPVALYMHNDWSMPVGTWSNIRKESGRLLADFVPDYADSDPEVQRLIGKVERGVIKMASVGLVELKGSDDEMLRIAGQSGITITGCRLREASIVAIGKNHNALRLYDNAGNELNLSDDTMNLSDHINIQTKQNFMNKEFMKVLNLSDTATEEQVLESVRLLLVDKQKSDDKAKELQGKLDAIDAAAKQARTAEALQLTDAAIRDGRIDAKTKDTFLTAFDRDFDGTKTMLAGITKPSGSVQEAIEHGKAALNLADKTWDDLDREGKLADLKASDFPLYSEKFKAKFGTEPHA